MGHAQGGRGHHRGAESSTSTTDCTENGDSQGGGPGGVDVSSVSTEEELVALVQEAYGDGGLGLHRGHDPDALVDSWDDAIDNVLATGEITEAQAEQYREALTEAFTFRVNWNGEDATPTFSGIDA